MTEVWKLISDPWVLWTVISIALPVSVGLIYILFYYVTKSKLRVAPHWVVCIAVAASLLLFVLPLHFAENGGVEAWKESFWSGVLTGIYALLQTAYNVVQLFTVNGEVADVLDLLPKDFPTAAKDIFTIWGECLYSFAPILTFGLILSFFKNLFSYIRYGFSSLWRQMHVFSELNEQSLALAESIKKRFGFRRTIVFCDIIDKKEEEHLDLVEAAERLGAIFFRKDMDSIRFANKKQNLCIRGWRRLRALVHSLSEKRLKKQDEEGKAKEIRIENGTKKQKRHPQRFKYNFYLICEDENEKLRHANRLICDYKERRDTGLYIFSDSEESKCFLDSYPKEEKESINMRIERVNDIRFLIYHYLDEYGIELFENAREENGIREISVAIVGLGRYGVELVKALLWYCQLPGYKVNITVFDKDNDAESRLQALFPGLYPPIKPENVEDDMRYSLRVIGNIDVGTKEFRDILLCLAPNLTQIFVTLGKDSENLATSIRIRRHLEQNRYRSTEIATVIYNSALKEHVNFHPEDGKEPNSQMEKMRIHAFGEVKDFYSVGTVINSQMVEEGYGIHSAWGKENSYYMDDYSFYSSVAKALHYRLRAQIMEKRAKEEELSSSAPLSSGDIQTEACEKRSCRVVFPEIFQKNAGTENWVYYIIQNTISSDIAEELRTAFETTVNELFEGEQSCRLVELSKEQIGSKTLDNCEMPGLQSVGRAEVLEIGKMAAKIDHVRWSAYMRTEGFVEGAINGEKSPEYRMHPFLIPVKDLPLEQCAKDI